MMIQMIAFDADDTLWHNENIFSMTQDKLSQLLAPYHDADWVAERLYQTEVRNLKYFGYGIKGFTLAMIETAIELTEGRIQGSEIQQIVELSKEMLRAPIELLDHVEDTLNALAPTYDLMIITKGDLFDQETKIARSGLADYFKHIEIVSDKTEATYKAILTEHGITPQDFVMVGNSLKSDILPVIAVGGRAVHIPYHVTWAHEIVADHETAMKPYLELKHIGLLPALVETL